MKVYSCSILFATSDGRALLPVEVRLTNQKHAPRWSLVCVKGKCNAERCGMIAIVLWNSKRLPSFVSLWRNEINAGNVIQMNKEQKELNWMHCKWWIFGEKTWIFFTFFRKLSVWFLFKLFACFLDYLRVEFWIEFEQMRTSPCVWSF